MQSNMNSTVTQENSTPSVKPTKRRNAVKIGVILAILALLFVLTRYFNVGDIIKESLEYVQGLGLVGAFVFALIYIAATVFLVPASILTLGAGFVYGVGWGFVLVSVSSTLGATAAFLVGRYFARGWVATKLAGHKRFAAIDEAVGKEGWKIVALTRLSPVFPFNLQNYAYGLTRVSLWHYVAASWIAMMPGTLLYVYLGSTVESLATLGAGERARTPMEWALYGVGLAVTVVVTVYITRLARHAMSRVVDAPTEKAVEA